MDRHIVHTHKQRHKQSTKTQVRATNIMPPSSNGKMRGGRERLQRCRGVCVGCLTSREEREIRRIA